MLFDLPGWRASRDLTEREWDLYIEGARAFQLARPESVEAAFESYFTTIYARDYEERGEGDYLPASKPFLLLRVMFACPERVRSPSIRMGGMWWGCTRADGTESISWPIRWDPEQNRPVQAGRYQGRDGPPYHPRDEYRLFAAHFKLRDLPKAR